MTTSHLIDRHATVGGILAPQLIVDARVLYFGYFPAAPDTVAALVPNGLRPAESRAVNMAQYVVDADEQTSGFGSYSLTHMGVDLAGLDLPDGTPGRWFTHYMNSNPSVREYARERGFPATEGHTVLETDGDRLVATTEADGVPIIRTTARIGSGATAPARGQARYVTRVGAETISGRYPFVGRVAESFEVLSLEILQRDHPTHALRPRQPLQVAWGFYFPRLSFCYPGGEERLETP